MGAERLCELLHPHRHVRVCEVEGAALVSAELGPEEGDLAALLRVVEAWLGESGFGPIRFHLDGRAYELDPGGALYPAAA
jgi:hypothetical protein